MASVAHLYMIFADQITTTTISRLFPPLSALLTFEENILLLFIIHLRISQLFCDFHHKIKVTKLLELPKL